jgi:hypothetical protein
MYIFKLLKKSLKSKLMEFLSEELWWSYNYWDNFCKFTQFCQNQYRSIFASGFVTASHFRPSLVYKQD